MSMMLHCGGVEKTYEELREMPTPMGATPRHFPVPYHMFVDEVRGAVAYAGMRIATETYALAARGQHFFGLVAVANGDQEKELVIGMRSSHNRTLPLSLAVGGRVFVCDNLAFSAEFVLATRSTPKVLQRLPMLAIEGVKSMVPYKRIIHDEMEGWKADRLADFAAERLMIAAMRTGVMPPRMLPRWVEEYDHPTAAEHVELAGTKLGLYNAATAAIRHNPDSKRGANLNILVRRTLELRSLFNWPLDRIGEWEAPRVVASQNHRLLTDSGEWEEARTLTDVDPGPV